MNAIPIVGTFGTTVDQGAATNYIVHTPTGRIILIYIYNSSGGSATLGYSYSDSDGASWKHGRIAAIVSMTQLAIWYDRWSDINADLIHIATTNSLDDDVKYTTLDAVTLAETAEVIAFSGASTATGNTMSLVRARGGNLILCGQIDAAAETFALKSTTVGATASFSAITSPMEATTDQIILVPGWAADNQDVMMFFWDASAEEISRKLYDDSANSWAETSIAGSMTDVVATTSYPHFCAAVDITNSQNVLVAWSAVDTANADLRCWKVTESAITEVTNVVLNSTDDQGSCAMDIDVVSGAWTVYYGGKSDGSETWNTNVGVYRKISTDQGSTWSAEEVVDAAWAATLRGLTGANRVYSRRMVSTVRVVSNNEQKYILLEDRSRSTNITIGII